MSYYGTDQLPPQVVQPPPMEQQQQTNAVPVPVPKSTIPPALELVGYIARGLSIIFTLIASAVMGSAKQTIQEVLYVYYLLIPVPVTIKFSLYSVLKYFVAANAIVLFFSIGSLALSIIFKSKNEIVKLAITIGDIIALSLLLSAGGAAGAASTNFDNIDHLTQESTCSVYPKFCAHVKASIVFSFFAVAMYLLLIILSLVCKKK